MTKSDSKIMSDSESMTRDDSKIMSDSKTMSDSKPIIISRNSNDQKCVHHVHHFAIASMHFAIAPMDYFAHL